MLIKLKIRLETWMRSRVILPGRDTQSERLKADLRERQQKLAEDLVKLQVRMYRSGGIKNRDDS